MLKYSNNSWMTEKPNKHSDLSSYQAWKKKDEFYEDLPEWSCNCILDPGAKPNRHNNGYAAYADCPNCFGYGRMPVPPSETDPQWK
jgi:hypothetical protein